MTYAGGALPARLAKQVVGEQGRRWQAVEAEWAPPRDCRPNLESPFQDSRACRLSTNCCRPRVGDLWRKPSSPCSRERHSGRAKAPCPIASSSNAAMAARALLGADMAGRRWKNQVEGAGDRAKVVDLGVAGLTAASW